MYNVIREGFRKKSGKSVFFCQTGDGGVSEGSKMPNLYFEKVFFQ